MEWAVPIRRKAQRCWTALWMLGLFAVAQLVPVAALAATDGMAGMACCKQGRDSCCRRKPMSSTPSFRAGHPCGMACVGMPTLAGQAGIGAAAPFARAISTVVAIVPVPAVHSLLSSGFNAVRWQRPPPVRG